MWELDYKESQELKNWCFWTVVLEKTLESPLDCKEGQPVNRKGNQSWIFIGRTDAEAPILWPPDVKNWLIWKDPDSSVSKESACNAEDLGSIPGSGRSPEKEMATHSSILAWRIPWTEEPGGSTGVTRVRHVWATKHSTHGAGNDRGQEETGTTEEGTAGWPHRLDAPESE